MNRTVHSYLTILEPARRKRYNIIVRGDIDALPVSKIKQCLLTATTCAIAKDRLILKHNGYTLCRDDVTCGQYGVHNGGTLVAEDKEEAMLLEEQQQQPQSFTTPTRKQRHLRLPLDGQCHNDEYSYSPDVRVVKDDQHTQVKKATPHVVRQSSSSISDRLMSADSSLSKSLELEEKSKLRQTISTVRVSEFDSDTHTPFEQASVMIGSQQPQQQSYRLYTQQHNPLSVTSPISTAHPLMLSGRMDLGHPLHHGRHNNAGCAKEDDTTRATTTIATNATPTEHARLRRPHIRAQCDSSLLNSSSTSSAIAGIGPRGEGEERVAPNSALLSHSSCGRRHVHHDCCTYSAQGRPCNTLETRRRTTGVVSERESDPTHATHPQPNAKTAIVSVAPMPSSCCCHHNCGGGGGCDCGCGTVPPSCHHRVVSSPVQQTDSAPHASGLHALHTRGSESAGIAAAAAHPSISPVLRSGMAVTAAATTCAGVVVTPLALQCLDEELHAMMQQRKYLELHRTLTDFDVRRLHEREALVACEKARLSQLHWEEDVQQRQQQQQQSSKCDPSPCLAFTNARCTHHNHNHTRNQDSNTSGNVCTPPKLRLPSQEQNKKNATANKSKCNDIYSSNNNTDPSLIRDSVVLTAQANSALNESTKIADKMDRVNTSLGDHSATNMNRSTRSDKQKTCDRSDYQTETCEVETNHTRVKEMMKPGYAVDVSKSSTAATNNCVAQSSNRFDWTQYPLSLDHVPRPYPLCHYSTIQQPGGKKQHQQQESTQDETNTHTSFDRWSASSQPVVLWRVATGDGNTVSDYLSVQGTGNDNNYNNLHNLTSSSLAHVAHGSAEKTTSCVAAVENTYSVSQANDPELTALTAAEVVLGHIPGETRSALGTTVNRGSGSASSAHSPFLFPVNESSRTKATGVRHGASNDRTAVADKGGETWLSPDITYPTVARLSPLGSATHLQHSNNDESNDPNALYGSPDVVVDPAVVVLRDGEFLDSRENAEANLRLLSNDLNMQEELVFDESNTCVVRLSRAYTLLVTYDAETEHLFLYSTLLTDVPYEPTIRLRLYEFLMENALLGRAMCGGGVGLSVEKNFILMSTSVYMPTSQPWALRTIVPHFTRALQHWREEVAMMLHRQRVTVQLDGPERDKH